MVMFYPKKYQESKLPSSHTLGEGLEVPLQYKTGTPREVEVDKLAKELKKKNTKNGGTIRQRREICDTYPRWTDKLFNGKIKN